MSMFLELLERSHQALYPKKEARHALWLGKGKAKAVEG